MIFLRRREIHYHKPPSLMPTERGEETGRRSLYLSHESPLLCAPIISSRQMAICIYVCIAYDGVATGQLHPPRRREDSSDSIRFNQIQSELQKHDPSIRWSGRSGSFFARPQNSSRTSFCDATYIHAEKAASLMRCGVVVLVVHELFKLAVKEYSQRHGVAPL